MSEDEEWPEFHKVLYYTVQGRRESVHVAIEVKPSFRENVQAGDIFRKVERRLINGRSLIGATEGLECKFLAREYINPLQETHNRMLAGIDKARQWSQKP